MRQRKSRRARHHQRFRKMLGLVRSHASAAEAQGRPKVEACQLPAFSILHFVPLRDETSGVDSCEFGEGDFQRSRASRAVKYQTWRRQKYQYHPGMRGLKATARDVAAIGMP